MSYSRVFGLDLLRCLAVILVLFAHTLHFLGTSSILNYCSFFSGIVGVEIFFVISGFLIGTILIKTHNQEDITKFNSIKIFWIRRWFRTLPNYYLMLIVYAILSYITNKEFVLDTWSGISHVFFLQNFISEISNYFYGVSWSLAVEEWFYLLFPILLLVSQFLFKNKRSCFLIVIILFIIVPILLRFFLFSMGFDIAWDGGYKRIVPLRLGTIGIGVFMAYMKWYFPQILESRKKVLFVFGILFFIVAMVILYKSVVLYSSPMLKVPHFKNIGFLSIVLLFPLIGFSIAMCLPFLNHIKIKDTSNYLYRFIYIISLISYSIYLSHPFYIKIVNHFLKNFSGEIKVVVIWGLVMLGSFAQYHLFEVKITSFRDRFGKEKDRISL